MNSKIFFEKKNNIAFIIIDNQKTLNAWDFEMRSQIISIIKNIQKNKSVRALIFSGKGNKAFCSGQNLKEIDKFNTSKKVIIWINQFKTYINLSSP